VGGHHPFSYDVQLSLDTSFTARPAALDPAGRPTSAIQFFRWRRTNRRHRTAEWPSRKTPAPNSLAHSTQAFYYQHHSAPASPPPLAAAGQGRLLALWPSVLSSYPPSERAPSNGGTGGLTTKTRFAVPASGGRPTASVFSANYVAGQRTLGNPSEGGIAPNASRRHRHPSDRLRRRAVGASPRSIPTYRARRSMCLAPRPYHRSSPGGETPPVAHMPLASVATGQPA